LDKPTIRPGERWHFENIMPGIVQGERIHRVHYEGRTRYQHVVIQDAEVFGRTLVLDDKTQSSESDEFIFHEALVQPLMICHPNPRSVFIAGGGEGATARETLYHRSVGKVIMVDLDKEVVELCKKYLHDSHHKGAFDDPRLEVHHEDALKYLENTSERFDIVIIDASDPVEAGPSFLLFTQEFYQLIKSRLKPNGMMVAQSGATGPIYQTDCFAPVSKTIGSVFPVSVQCEAYIPAFGSTWGFVIGSTGPDPSKLTASAVNNRIARRLASPLRYYDGETHRGMFSLPKYLRRALEEERRIITKSNPLFVC